MSGSHHCIDARPPESRPPTTAWSATIERAMSCKDNLLETGLDSPKMSESTLSPVQIRPVGRQENIVRLAVVTDAKEGLHPELCYFDQVRGAARAHTHTAAVQGPARNHPGAMHQVGHCKSRELRPEIGR